MNNDGPFNGPFIGNSISMDNTHGAIVDDPTSLQTPTLTLTDMTLSSQAANTSLTARQVDDTVCTGNHEMDLWLQEMSQFSHALVSSKSASADYRT